MKQRNELVSLLIRIRQAIEAGYRTEIGSVLHQDIVLALADELVIGDSHVDSLITDIIWLRDKHLPMKGEEPTKDEAYAYNLCDRILDKLKEGKEL